MSIPAIDRRAFISIGGGLLTLGLTRPVRAGTKLARGGAAIFQQRFLRIDADDRVTVFAKHLDMGQGIWTGLSQIVAEELDADWSQMRAEGAPARLSDYAHNQFKSQTTGGSTSISNSWDELRLAGATARAMLVSAAARRWDVSEETISVKKGRVMHVPTGRSSGFGQLSPAAALLPVPHDVVLKPVSQFSLLGTSVKRLDVVAKHRGKTRFGIDVQLPNMLYAVIARAPRFGGTVVDFDAKAALALSGVAKIVEVPSGVAVLARDSWSALRARDALVINWSYADAERRSTSDIADNFRDLAQEAGLSCVERGSPNSAIAAAADVIEAEFLFPYLAQAPLEPLCVVGRLDPQGCELWGGFQSQTANQAKVAEILGLEAGQVRLNTLPAGGSFGRRASFTSDWVAELAEVLKATGGKHPVKLMWTRDDDLAGGYYRPMFLHRYRIGLDEKGYISGLDLKLVGQSILFGQPTGEIEPPKADFLSYMGNMADRYAIENASVRWVNPHVHVPVHTFRSIGNTHTTLSKEIMIDRLARRAGIDPIDYRLVYLKDAPRQARVLRLAAEKAGWGQALQEGRALGAAVQESESSYVAQIAEVSLVDGNIHVHRVTCAIDCGFALDPDNIKAQMEGGIGFGLSTTMLSAITMTDGIVDQHNFDSYQLLRIADMPQIDVHIVKSSERPSGVGEPGSTPIGAAVVNAVELLTGQLITHFPIKGQGFT
jgi:isoquinoline 1-oxidoreductase beta subunit